MRKMVIFAGLAVMGFAMANASPFDITVKVQGASANGDAKSIEKIDLNASYLAYSLNNDNTTPITIKRGDETVVSIAPDDRQLLSVDSDDDWEDDAYMINLSQKLNQVGTYIIDVPEGFFKSSSKVNAAAHQVINVISPMPTTLEISGDGIANSPVAMTLSGTEFSASVEVTGTGSFKFVGDVTYYGTASATTALEPGVATPVGYQGKNFTIANGKYTVVVNWSDGNPTVTFTPKPATFDMAIKVQGASANGDAKSIEKIDLNASYLAYYLNSDNTTPITIKRGDETVVSIAPDDRQLLSVDSDDDWEDDAYMINLSQKLNQVGTYSIDVPEGFFKSSSKVNAAAHQVINVISPMPTTLEISGDGIANSPVAMTLSGTEFSASVEVTGTGSFKFVGDVTYYGTASATTALEPGVATPVGYQGKNFTIANGKYTVVVNWSDGNPTVTFTPKPATFDMEINVQGANAEGVANMFQRINFDSPYVAYWLNTANTMPIEIKRGEEVILTINSDDSQLLGVDVDDDWEDDAYMLSLSQKINRVGTYTITVPEGFFKNSSKVNAAASKEISIVSAMPAELTLRGDLKESTCKLTFDGTDTFSAKAVEVIGEGKVDLMGSTWYGVADGVAEITKNKPAPIGYQGGKWTVAPGVYDVKVVWNDNDPMITFSSDTSVGIDEIEVRNEDTEYFNLQGLRVENPEPGQIVIRKSEGKVSKIVIK